MSPEVRDCLRSLIPEEYAAAPVPTREQIHEALRRARDDMRRASSAPKRWPPAGVRYR